MDSTEYHKTYYQQNKDKFKECYENNKETILEKRREYRKNNKDKILEYCKKNKDILTEKYKEYYEKNKETILGKRREYNKEYRKINKEQIREKKKEYIKCRSCKLFQTSKKTNYLCSYCNPDKATRQKTKEMAVKTFLEENNYTFIYNKKCNLDKSCQTYYPDFLIDCNTFFVIVECDEGGHKSYYYTCERIRENNICYALGLPCVFIRFNPDKNKIKMKTKQKVLKSYIDYYINKEICDNVVEFLFY
jgi:hypothetical protein